MQLQALSIESVDLDAQGLAKADGKVIFVENALLGECVDVEIKRNKASYAKGKAIAWHRESSQRVVPRCRHFGVCGGCSMQHIEPTSQLAIKQRVLEDNLWHIARLKPEQMLSPLDGPWWGYRMRARLTARWVDKKGGMLLGFHERKSSYVAVMDSCEILPPEVSRMLPALRDLIGSLSIARRVPQAEVAVGEVAKGLMIVWVLRVLEPPSADDEALLCQFADQWKVSIWLQPGGPATAKPFWPKPAMSETASPGASGATPPTQSDAPSLFYRLPEFDLRMPFSPVDFTQVNFAINRVMVRRAVDLLGVQPTDRIADFFCGLGNFTRPLARRAGEVIGIEGTQALLPHAEINAQRHGLGDRVSFAAANLFEVDANWLTSLGKLDRVLMDPPREGAQALCQAMAGLHQSADPQAAHLLPSRIVYVSCNPATLARDAAILVHEGGWRLMQAGVINMFPHTSHVESMAVFDRP